jgi:hypothetical protein
MGPPLLLLDGAIAAAVTVVVRGLRVGGVAALPMSLRLRRTTWRPPMKRKWGRMLDQEGTWKHVNFSRSSPDPPRWLARLLRMDPRSPRVAPRPAIHATPPWPP